MSRALLLAALLVPLVLALPWALPLWERRWRRAALFAGGWLAGVACAFGIALGPGLLLLLVTGGFALAGTNVAVRGATSGRG